MNSTFGTRRLARALVIIQLLYLPLSIEQHSKLKKLIIFQFIVTDKVVFGAIFLTCAVYTKRIIIIHLSVSESGGYLPCCFASQQISASIHLHLSE